ncbi:NEDD8 ultimate buster 1 [Galendromus occidentalis]|uniref:NEDD8 ultimate buster 1 n=1 Tax=Galendromus occidentalis TaxID=34638 RepID=A0AAJ7L5M9_9ACAR|nr:NEDD8 ultimate buster 1 [Galendromus occidentalis]
MAFAQEVDPRMAHLAQFLRQNNVSLWERPYWQDSQANIPQHLLEAAAEECRIPIEITLELLLDLQKHALQRKEERQLLSEQGIVTIKVKLQRKDYNLKIPISSSVADLYGMVSKAAEIPRERIRLILNGQKLLDEDVPLSGKNMKNNTKIVGIVTSAKIEEFIRDELAIIDSNRKTNAAKANARTISALNRCEITNQFGEKVEIPDKIKLDLTAALSLHDKGRSELRRGKSEQALNYLLEAERISQSIDVSSYPVLERLSNVPLLNLDIVWCFLEAGSMNHSSDCDRRLLLAEEGFRKAYGPNMERVTKAKGNATNEQTLSVRLKLLQGVSAFYKASYGEARRKFSEVETLMAKLVVNEDHLLTLMSFGYTAKECRLALRQTNNIVELALTYLEEKQIRRKNEYERWKSEQQGKYLEGINKTLYDRMIDDVGVTPATARRALLEFQNDYNRAVDFAMEYECSVNKRRQDRTSGSANRGGEAIRTDEPGPSSAKSSKNSSSDSDVAALIQMGVEASCAEELLRFFKGSLIDAENFLLTGNSNKDTQVDAMLSRMSRFVSVEAEDYLDSTLEREIECLSVYSERLARIESALPSDQ